MPFKSGDRVRFNGRVGTYTSDPFWGERFLADDTGYARRLSAHEVAGLVDVKAHPRRGSRGVRAHQRTSTGNVYYDKAQFLLPTDLGKDIDEMVDGLFAGRSAHDKDVAKEAAGYMRGRIEAQLGRFDIPSKPLERRR
jgi:hypothetical protein